MTFPIADTRRPSLTPASLAAALTKPAMATIVWVVATLTIWQSVAKLPASASRFDFNIYYVSSLVAKEGGDPYTADFTPLYDKLRLQRDEVNHATDPPTLLLMREPLALISEPRAFYVWCGLNAALLACSLALLLGKAGAFCSTGVLTLAALALIYRPVAIHIQYAQSEILILFLLAAMLRLMERGSYRAAGLCLALAGLLKIFPVMLLGYFALRRRWRGVLWTVLGLAVGGLATGALFGMRNCLSFLSGVHLVFDRGWLARWTNISLRACVSRLIWCFAGANAGSSFGTFRQVAVLGADAALVAMTIRATLKNTQDEDWRALSMWIVAVVLLSPTAWVHYMVLYLIAFAQLAIAAANSRASTRAQWAGITSYLAVLIPASLPLLSPQWTYSTQANLHWPAWLIAVSSQTWFAAAALTYLAGYWFTVDGSGPYYELGDERDALSARQGLSE